MQLHTNQSLIASAKGKDNLFLSHVASELLQTENIYVSVPVQPMLWAQPPAEHPHALHRLGDATSTALGPRFCRGVRNTVTS